LCGGSRESFGVAGCGRGESGGDGASGGGLETANPLTRSKDEAKKKKNKGGIKGKHYGKSKRDSVSVRV